MPRSGVFLLHEKSILGRVLHTLIGYTSRPAGIQVVFYLGTLLIIGGLMRLVNRTAPAVP
jgi:high-affinity iron transporter